MIYITLAAFPLTFVFGYNMLYNLFVILFSLIKGKEMMWQSRMENPWIQDTGRGQKKPTEN